MKKVFVVGIVLTLLNLYVVAQSVEQPVEVVTPDGITLRGTLLLPSLEQSKPIPVALIVAGSGPTDRDGNNPMMMNNSLKMLAEALMKEGIATLRYDKRGIKASSVAVLDESKITLNLFAKDILSWVGLLKNDSRFNNITLIGHSEGASLAMRAVRAGAEVDQIISIAGAGRPLQTILKEQLSTQPPQIRDLTYAIIDTLESGKMYDSVPFYLNSIFRPSVQPALIEEFKVEPAKLAASIQIPMLVVQGTTDIQITTQDAKSLSSSNKAAELLIIENMNHVLKECETMDKMMQTQYYSNPILPLHTDLVPGIMYFLNEAI